MTEPDTSGKKSGKWLSSLKKIGHFLGGAGLSAAGATAVGAGAVFGLLALGFVAGSLAIIGGGVYLGAIMGAQVALSALPAASGVLATAATAFAGGVVGTFTVGLSSLVVACLSAGAAQGCVDIAQGFTAAGTAAGGGALEQFGKVWHGNEPVAPDVPTPDAQPIRPASAFNVGDEPALGQSLAPVFTVTADNGGKSPSSPHKGAAGYSGGGMGRSVYLPTL